MMLTMTVFLNMVIGFVFSRGIICRAVQSIGAWCRMAAKNSSYKINILADALRLAFSTQEAHAGLPPASTSYRVHIHMEQKRVSAFLPAFHAIQGWTVWIYTLIDSKRDFAIPNRSEMGATCLTAGMMLLSDSLHNHKAPNLAWVPCMKW